MINCILDGKVGYPSTTSNIKVTYENGFVNDSSEYTLEIEFPMTIVENQRLFHFMHKFEVSKTISVFSDCKLFADNRLIVSGKGHVTSATPSVVKLQIAGGKSRIKYDSKFEADYIDKLNLGSAPDSKIDMNNLHLDALNNLKYYMDLAGSVVPGVKGQYAFNPIWDETGSYWMNIPSYNPTLGTLWLNELAIQPNLVFVVKKVLEAEGFTVIRNDFDQAPWNQLIVMNCYGTLQIAKALPHWTIYDFLENVRKFLNATFVFHDAEKTVEIVALSELISKGVKEYKCLDDFAMEYEDDGLSTLSTSNVAYNFPESENRSWKEYISNDILKAYTVKSYSSISEMNTAAQNMTVKDRQTTIFKVAYNYYIYGYDEDDTDDENEKCIRVGYFNPLIRDSSSDNTDEIVIVPVATAKIEIQDQKNTYSDYDIDVANFEKIFHFTDVLWHKNVNLFVPSMKQERNTKFDYQTGSDDNYVSVQDAMNGSSKEETTADEKMQVAFQSSVLYNYTKNCRAVSEDDPKNNILMPFVFSDSRLMNDICGNKDDDDGISLSLEALPESIGSLDESNYTIDKNNQITIQFLSDNIPDPSNVYLFRGKKYICEKIEVTVNNRGVDKIKTGYFYELH
ncbi:MAG TPA: hypothetical protein DCS83_06815 [Prevotella sp.]|nr:hypothetical protein [Prevotella sp.]